MHRSRSLIPAHPEIMDRAANQTSDQPAFLPNIGLLPKIRDERRGETTCVRHNEDRYDPFGRIVSPKLSGPVVAA
jgi:hypothetical protein